jgi:F0F1-type ATP synthase membrane subunit b/b'
MLVWQLILLQLITFVVLAVLLHQFLYRQVTRSLGRLQTLYQENLQREEELKRKGEETEAEFRKKVAQHSEEMKRLRAEAEAAAHKMQEESLAQAKEEGRRIVAEAEAKRERMRASLVSEMEQKAVGLASDIIGRVLTAPLAQEIHRHLIDEVIEEIGNSDGPRPELDADTVEVVVPFPLTPPQHERLNTIFSSIMNRSVTIKETLDEEVVAGMVVRVGNVVLDASLKNRLKGMLAYVRENLAR